MSVFVVSKQAYDTIKCEDVSSRKEDATIQYTNSSYVIETDQPIANMEAEKRIRREIANSNERRRMQSINNGFQSLRSLLPHHEGEKLSKAAILQQTAEYIYSLEQEKTRLLSQNCQLKRLVNQHEVGELPLKKRKTDVIVPMSSSTSSLFVLSSSAAAASAAAAAPFSTAGESSSDEGVGSMSPEPCPTITSIGAAISLAPDSPIELRRQLDMERGRRCALEEQIKLFETRLLQLELLQQDHVVVSEKHHLTHHGASTIDNSVIIEELDLQVVDNVPPVGSIQTVVCSSPVVSRTASPEPQQPLQHESSFGVSSSNNNNNNNNANHQKPRLPSVLEAAIKAEPKVEVERLASPTPNTNNNSNNDDNTVAGRRVYVSNTTRQNLETIVEAIRHLEGDHLFEEEPQKQLIEDDSLELTSSVVTEVDEEEELETIHSPTEYILEVEEETIQESPEIVDEQLAPLPPPTKSASVAVAAVTTADHILKSEMNTFLDFRSASIVQQRQQSRPGVIVVKQAS